MTRIASLLLLTLTGGVLVAGQNAPAPTPAPAGEPEGETPIFRSDVSLVRIDAQVLGRGNQAITNLRQEDFVLREEGQTQEIRHFSREEMPVDVVLLLDVSGSMRPHVERIATAAHTALQVLGEDDRVAIMVFDRRSRVRLPFRNSREDVQRALNLVLSQETFDGGTDITRALYDATAYLSKEARKDARRAVVILTDDRTERNRDEAGVGRALLRADAVLSALIAPDALDQLSGGSGGNGGVIVGGGGGSGWPMGGPLGGIIFGRRGPLGGGGGRFPGGGGGGGNVGGLQSAGTSEIARASGGDSLVVDDATALETTLLRIRQRYALHFHLPPGVQPGQERNIDVQLTAAARRRYPDAEVRFRRVYQAPGGSDDPFVPPAEPSVITSAPSPSTPPPAREPERTPAQRSRRRPAVDDTPDVSRTERPTISQQGGWRRADGTEQAPAPAAEPARARVPAPAAQPAAPAEPAAPASAKGGWRRVKPGEVP